MHDVMMVEHRCAQPCYRVHMRVVVALTLGPNTCHHQGQDLPYFFLIQWHNCCIDIKVDTPRQSYGLCLHVPSQDGLVSNYFTARAGAINLKLYLQVIGWAMGNFVEK